MAPSLEALRRLTEADLPRLAVVGGTGVNIRLATSAAAHRATPDIDVVVDEREPTAIELLAREHDHVRPDLVVVEGVDVEVIPTYPIEDRELADIDDDGDRLFLAGHRWALETARPVRLTLTGSATPEVRVPVATAAGLVAAKSHAAGHPRPERRANKHGGDLYDLFRLVEVFDAEEALRTELASAPGGLGRLVAAVVRREVLANPARAMRQMSSVTAAPLDVDRIVDVLEPFAEDLDR